MVRTGATVSSWRMDIRQQFGIILRERRTSLGLTQEELAFRTDMNVTYLSDLERGRNNPSLAMIVDLAKALGTHPADLLHGLELNDLDEPPKRRRPVE